MILFKKDRLLISAIIFILFIIKTDAQERWSPQQVYYGKGGKLTYTPDEKGNIIPDFSHVGYMYGDEPIPDVPVVMELEPVKGDNRDHIQHAINYLYSQPVDENGFRGAILLKKGVYNVSRGIQIKNSGIVLRGEGDDDEGTVIIADGKIQYKVITVGNDNQRVISNPSKIDIVEDYTPVGQKYVVVSDASRFSVGESVVIYRPGTTKWIVDLKMDQIPPRPDGDPIYQWKASDYSLYFERLITDINGDTLFFRNPIVMEMDKEYGGGAVYKYSFNRVEKVGIENICLKSNYSHDTDEDHAWRGIEFNSAENCWARDITGWYFGYSVVSTGMRAKLITVENCHSRDMKSIITGGRRYPFVTNGSKTLFKGCTSTEARHDYVTNGKVSGPNVYIDCTASITHNDIGPHGKWATGTLYDRVISDGAINVQDRDNYGTGQGWAGANHVFWACESKSSICQSPWVTAVNYNFGYIGEKKPGKVTNRPDGVWVGHNVRGIFPESLFEAQYNERMHGATVFSLYPELIFDNDTTLHLEFSLPLDANSVIPQNFNISLSDGGKITDFTIIMVDSYSVKLYSEKLRHIPGMVTLSLKLDGVQSDGGHKLNGVSSLSYTFPDLRPVVTGNSGQANNVDGVFSASSSKEGFIYFVGYGIKVSSKAELDSLVENNLARGIVADKTDTFFDISVKGLPGGFYYYYAVDLEGRVSEPTRNYVIIDQVGPVTSSDYMLPGRFSVRHSRGTIIVEPSDYSLYSLKIFTVAGHIIHDKVNLSGPTYIDSGDMKGLIFIRIQESDDTFETVKLNIF